MNIYNIKKTFQDQRQSDAGPSQTSIDLHLCSGQTMEYD